MTLQSNQDDATFFKKKKKTKTFIYSSTTCMAADTRVSLYVITLMLAIIDTSILHLAEDAACSYQEARPEGPLYT